MSERISCPGCQRALHLPRDCNEPWLACPNCAARIPNPQAEAVIPEVENRNDPCPSCGAGVQPYWLFCSHCEEPLHASAGNAAFGRILRSVSILLGVAGGMGTILALVASLVALEDGREIGPLLVTLAALFTLALLSTIIVVRRPCPGQSVAARIFSTTLSLAGALVVGGCLWFVPVFGYYALLDWGKF